MALPKELILEVCKHLAKHDLKACRLVSKSWSHQASEYLFSKIYMSPRKEDIEVFNLITQHAQLSHCVRLLEYDGTSFSPSYSSDDYIQCLYTLATLHSNLYRTSLNNADLQFTQFLESCWETSEIAEQEYSSHAFVLEGLREWKDRDQYQQRIVKNGEFLQILTRGLRKLDHLNSVDVCSYWYHGRLSDSWREGRPWSVGDMDLSYPYLYGSPFGRAWGLSHPIPRYWVQMTSPTENFTTGREEFQIITTALSQSQRKVRSFHISPPPVSIFDSNLTEDLVNHSFNAYSSLENLDLRLNEYGESTEMSVKYESLPGLQALLRSMGGLRRLELVLPHDELHEDASFNYRQVFPTDGTQWTRLTKFDIDVFAISVKDLVHLLTAKMPSLRELTFGEVELLEGRWEGIIEFFKTSMHLLSCRLSNTWHLRHLGGKRFMDEMAADVDTSSFCEKIETYVVSGGRHPCLRPGDDVSASREYLLDLGL